MNLQRAIEIAVAAHREQFDKQGGPYITHPMRLMNAVEGESAQIVAVLHDVVEDTNHTFEQLRDAGLSAEVLEALRLLTHDKSTPYVDYVIAIKSNPIARAVKLADLHDNSRLDRALLRYDRAEDDFRRIHRYFLSFQFLSDRISPEQYRELMQRLG